MSVPNEPEPVPESILMRYYTNAEVEPTSLKLALEKVRGVKKVEFKADRVANVSWIGKCKDLASLENAASACGVPAVVINHAHVYIAFKPLKGANLETLQKALEGMKGVKGARVSGTAAELHVDMQELAMADVRSASKEANFEPQVKSHQWVEAAVKSGETSRVEKEIAGLRGVMVYRSEADVVGFWALKAVTDGMLTRAAEKVGATAEWKK